MASPFIFQARIDHQGDNRGAGPQSIPNPQSGHHICSRRRPRKYPLFSGQSPSHRLCFLRANRLDFVHERRIQKRRQESNSDPLDIMRTGLSARQDRRLCRLNRNDANAGLVTPQDRGHSSQRGRCSNRVNKGIHLPLRLVPNLFAKSE